MSVITGFSKAHLIEVNKGNYLVHVRGDFTFGEGQTYLTKAIEAVITNQPHMEYAYIYGLINGESRFYWPARQLPTKVKPVQMVVCDALLRSYFTDTAKSEIRYFFKRYQGSYKCLCATWDTFGPDRGNVNEASGKLLTAWDEPIRAPRLELLDACSDHPGVWQSNGYHYPNSPSWDLFNKAQSLIPRGFEFIQNAVYMEGAAVVNGERADYFVTVKDAPRYHTEQRAFWESVSRR